MPTNVLSLLVPLLSESSIPDWPPPLRDLRLLLPTEVLERWDLDEDFADFLLDWLEGGRWEVGVFWVWEGATAVPWETEESR